MKQKAISIISTCAMATGLQAAVLANYDFQASNGNPATPLANTTVGVFTPGAFDIAGDPNPATITYGSGNAATSGDVSIRPTIDSNSGSDNQVVVGFTNGLAAAYYYDFKVSANSGFSLDIENLVIRSYFNGGLDSYGLRLTTDNFSTSEDISVDSVINDSTITHDFATLVNDIADYQGISELTVRLVHYDDDGTAGTQTRSGFEEITLNGSVAPVPEPSSTMLIAAASLFLYGLRRRK